MLNNCSSTLKQSFHGIFRRLILVLALASCFIVLYSLHTNTIASAASGACTVPSGAGTDQLGGSGGVNVASGDTYHIWVRMQVATAGDSVMLQIAGINGNTDSTQCYTVGGNAASLTPADGWVWVNYQNGTTSNTMTTTLTAGYHSMELIGTGGDEVDRVILDDSSADCVPTGTGNNCTPQPPVSVPYYQQSGGPGFTDATDGVTWAPDQYYTTDNSYGASGSLSNGGGDGSTCVQSVTIGNNENCTGDTITIPGSDTVGPKNQEAYQTERWGDFHYDVPINNGTYDVVLNFAEINPNGNRIYNITSSNGAVPSNFTPFDLTTTAGSYTAYSQEFQVTVTNGDLNLGFAETGAATDAAKLSSFEILPQATPTVALTAPAANATVSGTTTISATASEGGSTANIQKVVFAVDGTTVDTATTSPYTYQWNTTSVSNASHAITATVTDNNGVTQTASENVTVANSVCNGPTTAPSGLTAVQNPTTPSGSVNLTWTTAGVAAANCTLAGYHVYVTAGGTTNELTDASITKAYTATGLSANTSYSFQITAYDTSSGGHESTKSSSSSVTTATTNCVEGGGQPTTPTLTEGSNSYNNITLTWTRSTVSSSCSLSGYHLYRNGVELSPDQTSGATSFSDTITVPTGAASNGVTNAYKIVAFDNAGNLSATEGPISMSTQKDNVAPAQPTGFSGTASSGTSVTLNWTKSSGDLPNPGGVGVEGYYIYLNDNYSTAIDVVNGANAASDTITGLTSSTGYKFEISAFDFNNNISAPIELNNSNSTVTTSSIVGDFNGDHHVNIYDLTALLSHWGQNASTVPGWDINSYTGSPLVNIFALTIFLANWTN